MHKDINNDYQTKNYDIPAQCPGRGGDLWVELKPGDTVCGPIVQRNSGSNLVYGQRRELQPGRPITCSVLDDYMK